MKPNLFIGSSVESIDTAYAVQENLEHDTESTVWTQGIFDLSRTTLASLIDIVEEVDFAVFIFSPDDVTSIRNESKRTVRDNVIFELGLFVGKIGIERCFIVAPRGVENLHLPTDLIGITLANFDADRQDRNLVAALGSSCSRIRRVTQKLGFITKPSINNFAHADAENLCNDPNDCINAIQAWMGGRPASDNIGIIRYDHVDQILKLHPGSTKIYIEQAAQHWGYSAARKGKDTIMFREARFGEDV